MRKRLPGVPKLEAYGAFGQQLWALLKLVLPPTGMAALMSALAKASGILTEYAPFSWAALGLLFGLVFATVLALYGFWLERRSRARLHDVLAVSPKSVNPLEDMFVRQNIRLSDFFSPFLIPHTGKKFINCHIHGPANILLMPPANFTRSDVRMQCDFVVVRNNAHCTNVTVFQDCYFEACRFFYVTFLVPELLKTRFEAGFNNPVPWITLDEAPSSLNSPERPSGTPSP